MASRKKMGPLKLPRLRMKDELLKVKIYDLNIYNSRFTTWDVRVKYRRKFQECASVYRTKPLGVHAYTNCKIEFLMRKTFNYIFDALKRAYNLHAPHLVRSERAAEHGIATVGGIHNAPTHMRRYKAHFPAIFDT